MENKLISIIVPVYNVEHYLSKCLDSICRQTYKELEIILVDDGSTDSSSKIINAYMQNDSRIKSLKQKNSGVSSARNLGLKNAKGDWICFVDSDDYLSPDYVEVLVHNAQKGISLAISGLTYFSDSVCGKMSFFDQVYTKEDIFSAIISQQLYQKGGPVGKLFKKDIIVERNIFFDVHMSYAEDYNFLLQYLKYIDRVKFLSRSDTYYYRVGRNGTLSTRYNSFENELYCLKQISKRYLEFKELSLLCDADFIIMKGTLITYVLRSINSIPYPIDYSNFISRCIQINNSFLCGDLQRSFKLYKSYCLHDRIQCFFLSRKLYRFLFLYNRLFLEYRILKKKFDVIKY